MTEEIEPDRVEGAPHPRETRRLIGQEPAEAAFLEAYISGRLHHAWLISGPRGVGKATLAWRLARFLLAEAPAEAGLFGEAEAPATLDIAEAHPVTHRIAALSEPRLKLIRRPWDDKKGALKTQIGVDDARALKGFFQMSATEGGRRVVIVDAADEMTPAAANALLKVLEEPPARAVLLLISHQPARLLPTIRSRCREMRLAPLDPAAMAEALAQVGVEVDRPEALAELSGGSVGEAIRLTNLDGLATYARLVGLFAPRLDRPGAIRLAESAAGRANEPKFDLILRLIDLFLARAALSALHGPPPEAAPGEAALMARLAPGPEAARPWAEQHEALGARGRHAKAVNLDPAALILDILIRIDQTAAETSAR